jgi:lipopolysaccharide/colanic/teichoic acid biosynthesis glycosyltransferase
METVTENHRTTSPPRSTSLPPWWQNGVKRAFDIFASLLGLIVLSPFFLAITVLIKRESPGPAFYRGTRFGRNGKEFNILKFRTMYERTESYNGVCLTAKDDDRITPFGRWLRVAKLNELPQLWNVLKGEMSLVGPRPEDPEIARTWPAEILREILSVRPGITSPASVVYRDEENLLQAANVMDVYFKDIMPDKLRLDQLYVRNHNFLSDLDIIFLTLITLMPKLRKNPIPTEMLYNGLLYRFMHRYFSWFLMDSLVALTAVALAGFLWRLSGPLNLGWGVAIGVAVGMALIFSWVNSLMGLGRIWWRNARAAYAFDLALSSVVSTLLVTALDWLWPNGRFLPEGLVIVAGLLAFLGLVSIRYRERLLIGLAARWFSGRDQSKSLGERVLVVGAGTGGLLASWLLHHSNLSPAFSIIGMVDDDPAKQGMLMDSHRVIGLTHRIPELVEKYDIGVILFAIEKIQPVDQTRILSLCRQTPARVVLIPDLLAILRERLSQSSTDFPMNEKRNITS